MNDRPEMKYINRYVKEEVCASGPEAWLELGTELLDKKDVAALYKIVSDVTECSIRCSKMFKLWLERQPEASWRRLIIAMKQIRMDKLASDVETLLLKEKTSEGIVMVDQQVLQSGQLIHPSQAKSQAPSYKNGMFK